MGYIILNFVEEVFTSNDVLSRSSLARKAIYYMTRAKTLEDSNHR